MIKTKIGDDIIQESQAATDGKIRPDLRSLPINYEFKPGLIRYLEKYEACGLRRHLKKQREAAESIEEEYGKIKDAQERFEKMEQNHKEVGWLRDEIEMIARRYRPDLFEPEEEDIIDALDSWIPLSKQELLYFLADNDCKITPLESFWLEVKHVEDSDAAAIRDIWSRAVEAIHNYKLGIWESGKEKKKK